MCKASRPPCIGWPNIYRQQGQVEQAMALYEQSLALKETIGDVERQVGHPASDGHYLSATGPGGAGHGPL